MSINEKKSMIPRGFFCSSQKSIVVLLAACFIRKKTLAPIGATGVVVATLKAINPDNKIRMSVIYFLSQYMFLGVTSVGTVFKW